MTLILKNVFLFSQHKECFYKNYIYIIILRQLINNSLILTLYYYYYYFFFVFIVFNQ